MLSIYLMDKAIKFEIFAQLMKQTLRRVSMFYNFDKCLPDPPKICQRLQIFRSSVSLSNMSTSYSLLGPLGPGPYPRGIHH